MWSKGNPLNNKVLISLDIDWAPDFVLEKTARIFEEYQVKSTWFVTHDSEFVRFMLTKPDLFELGIHPNFFKGSTQGSTEREVLLYLLNIIPNATSVRTHGLFQYSGLMRKMCVDYGIRLDSSIFLPYMQNISPHHIDYGLENQNRLIRAPYYWGDYTAFSRPEGIGEPNDELLSPRGMKIFNFHPIHIGLNSSDLIAYEELKARKSMSEIDSLEFSPFVQKPYGSRDFLIDLVKWVQKNQIDSFFLKDLIRH